MLTAIDWAHLQCNRQTVTLGMTTICVVNACSFAARFSGLSYSNESSVELRIHMICTVYPIFLDISSGNGNGDGDEKSRGCPSTNIKYL